MGSWGFRPDIEGLRAIAIGLVLVYHAGLRYVPGGFVGVDVFFVISGFLITGLLIREIEKTGRFSLRAFYARRAKRLLPAAAAVLVVTSILVWVFLPITQRRVFGGDIVSAAAYVVNWRLAGRSVDYLAEGIGASPVQHFWSLAVEEQFYLVWPLLLLVVVLVLRHRLRRGRVARPRRLMGFGLAAVGLPSFVASVVWTSASPQVAFFVTPTRLWEMSVGAAVAVGAAWWVRLPRWTGGMLGILGLGAVIVSGLCLDGTAAWPGSAALLPVLGTAVVIIGGTREKRALAARLLGWRPLVWIGGLSYSLYLWHWPLLVAAQAEKGSVLRVREALVIVVVSGVLAWLCHRYVENPFRFSARFSGQPRRALGFGGIFMLVGVVAGVGIILPSVLRPDEPSATTALGAQAVVEDPGLDPATISQVTGITPAPEDATKDIPVTYADGCQVSGDKVKRCVYGDVDSSVVVALVGDSKAAQWESALDVIAKKHGWRLETFTKSSCAFSDATQRMDGQPNTPCVTWNDEALSRILAEQVNLVVTSQDADRGLSDPSDGGSDYRTEVMRRGLVKRWQTLADAGIPVIALAGNPAPGRELDECVAEHRDDLTQCSFRPKFSVADVQKAAASQVTGVHVVSLNDLICPHRRCAAVIGNVLVYRQSSHLTKTFVDSTEPQLEERIESALPDIFAREPDGSESR